MAWHQVSACFSATRIKLLASDELPDFWRPSESSNDSAFPAVLTSSMAAGLRKIWLRAAARAFGLHGVSAAAKTAGALSIYGDSSLSRCRSSSQDIYNLVHVTIESCRTTLRGLVVREVNQDVFSLFID